MRRMLLLIIISVLLFTGCSATLNDEISSYIEEPEKIQFHNNGTTINIEKNTQHYRMILSLINKGIEDTSGTGIMKYTTKQPTEETVKTTGHALEFLYEESITSELMIDGRIQKVSYDRVLIPLDDDVILLGNDEGYGSRGLSITFVPKDFVATVLKDRI